MSNTTPENCRYCSFCSKVKDKGYGGLINPWVPPNLTEYECLRTYRKIGRAGQLYTKPDWCPLQDEN